MFEVLLEDCRLREEEARQVETFPEEPEEESTDTEMADDEGRGDPEPSDLHEEADAEVAPPPPRMRALSLWYLAGTSSLLRRMPSSCSQHPNRKA